MKSAIISSLFVASQFVTGCKTEVVRPFDRNSKIVIPTTQVNENNVLITLGNTGTIGSVAFPESVDLSKPCDRLDYLPNRLGDVYTAYSADANPDKYLQIVFKSTKNSIMRNRVSDTTGYNECHNSYNYKVGMNNAPDVVYINTVEMQNGKPVITEVKDVILPLSSINWTSTQPNGHFLYNAVNVTSGKPDAKNNLQDIKQVLDNAQYLKFRTQ